MNFPSYCRSINPRRRSPSTTLGRAAGATHSARWSDPVSSPFARRCGPSAGVCVRSDPFRLVRQTMTPDPQITPESFVAEWKDRNLSERQAAQTHFIQLCRLLGVAAPLDHRQHDEDYLFDAVTESAGSMAYAAARRGASKGGKGKAKDTGPALFGESEPAPSADIPDSVFAPGVADSVVRVVSGKGYGFADVWKRGCFCWEYKRQGVHADPAAALAQLRLYAPSLGNPPLLIVCDVDAFEIHTNFTNYPSTSFRFKLEDLAHPPEEWATKRGISPLSLLRSAFDPESVERVFRPAKRLDAITEEYAGKIARLADELDPAKTEDGEPVSRQEVAHFLMQIVFALFAEDVGLLPRDRMTKLLQQGNDDPKGFTRKIRSLFKAMADGGDFGDETIDHFNGGLFRNVDKQRIPKLTAGQLGVFVTVGKDDWSAIEPSILGTLFERALNPQKRSQIGAHYTSREDIMLIVGPVVLTPLRREWSATQETVFKLTAKRERASGKAGYEAAHKEIKAALTAFHDRLASVTILDPACGSGNFLYVAIQCLLDLERELIAFAARNEIAVKLTPRVSPKQLRGIEIDEYAAELARVSIWIGFLKWKHLNSRFGDERPILQSLDSIENRDAILDRSHGLPTAAKWPDADFIIGNPPFLGSKLFRKQGLTDDYLKALFTLFDLPNSVDLCCYWFERARQVIEKRPQVRAGLLATQGIRGGDNRSVLARIKKSGDIFMAWSDREWILDGAAVQVSMVGFDSGRETHRTLDGRPSKEVHADLTDDIATHAAQVLDENGGLAFMGDTKGGAFDLPLDLAFSLLSGTNVNQRSNRDVVFPWVNGLDVTRRNRGMMIVDFGCNCSESDASRFEKPFAHVERFVKPERSRNRRETYSKRWWIHVEPRPAMRDRLDGLRRFVGTPTLTKHRLFAWQSHPTLPDHQLIVFARSDDYFFGVLHSTAHEVWARRTGTQLREAESGFRYTPTSTFETFPLPWPPGKEPTKPEDRHHELWKAIGDAAAELNTLRESWLNPPEWIAAVEKLVETRYRAELAGVPDDVRPMVKQSAIMAEAAKDAKLKDRTLTNLYNARPAWLRLAHKKLDEAVLAAYAAVDPQGKWDKAWASVYEPFGAGEIGVRTKGTKKQPADSPDVAAQKQAIIAQRAEIDAKILGALLRLNGERARANVGPEAATKRDRKAAMSDGPDPAKKPATKAGKPAKPKAKSGRKNLPKGK